MNKETKGNPSTTSEDSSLRELKKEIIKLKSLCRRAAEEIRDLDGMIIKSIEDNKVIEYPEEDKTYFAGFSSINLLNRLDGRTNGGYVENYEDLNLELKMTTDNKYRHIKEDCVAYQEGGMGCPDCYCDSSCKDDSCHICGGNTPGRIDDQIEWLENKTMVREKHPSDCKWHKDWHACDCGMFDNEEEYIPLRSLYEQVISRINKLDDDTREAKGHLNILVLDRFLADITKLVGE